MAYSSLGFQINLISHKDTKQSSTKTRCTGNRKDGKKTCTLGLENLYTNRQNTWPRLIDYNIIE